MRNLFLMMLFNLVKVQPNSVKPGQKQDPTFFGGKFQNSFEINFFSAFFFFNMRHVIKLPHFCKLSYCKYYSEGIRLDQKRFIFRTSHATLGWY